jgi:hypothetical protein
MEKFGAWGKHPVHTLLDLRSEMANGDAQRGYWDFVAAQCDAELSGCASVDAAR